MYRALSSHSRRARHWPVALDADSPLTQGLTFCAPLYAQPAGFYRDMVTGVVGVPEANVSAGAHSAGPSWESGPTARSTARGTSSQISFGDNAAIVPTSEVTIGLRYRPTATATSSSALGVTGTGNLQRVNIHLPYAGVVYWDWGNATSYSRISVGGLTFGSDAWVFTLQAGVSGSQRIYQNGILRQSGNPGAGARTTTSAGDFILFGYGATASDLAEISECSIWQRMLSDDEIERWTWDGGSMLASVGAKSYFIPEAAGGAFKSAWAANSTVTIGAEAA